VSARALLIAEADGALGTGNVIIEAGGRLMLRSGAASNYIANGALLQISLGAAAGTVNLDFSGTDTIGSISFDGGATLAAAGTWGSPASNAEHSSGLFTGAGILNVVSGPAAANPFGVFTINRGLWDNKMPDAVWDRGFVRLNSIVKSPDGTTFQWGSALSEGIDGNFYGTNCFNSGTTPPMPNDRNWTLVLADMPGWLQASGTTVLTPNNWTDWKNLVKWVVAQFPSQVKMVEVSNEMYWSGSTQRGWQDAPAMAEYIKQTAIAVREANPALIVGGPTWTRTGQLYRDWLVSLAGVTLSDGTHPLDWLNVITMHNYSGDDMVGAEAKFTQWADDLDEWYAKVDSLGYGHLPHYWTEFGWPLIDNDENGNPTNKIVTGDEAARLYARGMACLKAAGSSGIIPFSMAAISGTSAPNTPNKEDFAFYNPYNVTTRPAYPSAAMAMRFLKDAGAGTITISGSTQTVVDFKDRAVIWDGAGSYNYTPAFAIGAAADLYGNPITISGTTIPIGPAPVYVAKNLVVNSGFELLNASGTAKNFSYISYNGAPTIAVDGATSHSGSNSIQIYGSGTTNRGAVSGSRIPVIGGRQYKLTVWYRSAGSISADAILSRLMAWHTAGGTSEADKDPWVLSGTQNPAAAVCTVLQGATDALNGSNVLVKSSQTSPNQWSNFSATFQLPATTVELSIELFNWYGDGTVWFDDASISLVP
jgi:hypothetical protein